MCDGPETIPPQRIFYPTVFYTTSTTASIEWTTDEPSDSQVMYGAVSLKWGSYDSVNISPAMVSVYSVKLEWLAANTTYYFRVGSTDVNGNGPDFSATDNNPSSEGIFTTDQQ